MDCGNLGNRLTARNNATLWLKSVMTHRHKKSWWLDALQAIKELFVCFVISRGMQSTNGRGICLVLAVLLAALKTSFDPFEVWLLLVRTLLQLTACAFSVRLKIWSWEPNTISCSNLEVTLLTDCPTERNDVWATTAPYFVYSWQDYSQGFYLVSWEDLNHKGVTFHPS